ncbi:MULTISPECIES: hypothetical protein [Protofrankia]|uniref:Uncharacterized protein n=1 Tax=Protofrankia coriariae TaxID=1562887 RepID=A0ABR5F4E8_9ACTN|nr:MULTISPECIES: hypothetical protein [Protofrankia]KLL11563.1 hypothetical protein FrCorBMG51_11020 [Protofrankia coriariae]ONH35697.1 hypothetical protein BL254_10415 [Protofrankia sp. BMG5.30]
MIAELSPPENPRVMLMIADLIDPMITGPLIIDLNDADSIVRAMKVLLVGSLSAVALNSGIDVEDSLHGIAEDLRATALAAPASAPPPSPTRHQMATGEIHLLHTSAGIFAHLGQLTDTGFELADRMESEPVEHHLTLIRRFLANLADAAMHNKTECEGNHDH